MQPDRPDELVLQYWFYWYFNDWNNTHEGDWEADPARVPGVDGRGGAAGRPDRGRLLPARGRRDAPTGPTTSSTREGGHPVVYSSAGSHASYFGSALYLGRNGSEGFGCDNTDGPSTRIDPEGRRAARRAGRRSDGSARVDRVQRPVGRAPRRPVQRTGRALPEGPLRRAARLAGRPAHSSVIVPAGDIAGRRARSAASAASSSGAPTSSCSSSCRRRAGLVTLVILGAIALFIIRRTSWKLRAAAARSCARRPSRADRACVVPGVRPAPDGAFGRSGCRRYPLAFIGGAIAAIVAGLPLLGSITDLFDTGEFAPLVDVAARRQPRQRHHVGRRHRGGVMGDGRALRRSTPSVAEVLRAVADHAVPRWRRLRSGRGHRRRLVPHGRRHPVLDPAARALPVHPPDDHARGRRRPFRSRSELGAWSSPAGGTPRSSSR